MRMRVVLAVMVLLAGMATGCGDDDEAATTVAPTTTAATTTTTTSTSTTTTTTVPKVATISGRVFLYDRDNEGVSTTIFLEMGEDGEEVDSAHTDADGYFAFVVDVEGDYTLQASIFGLWDECENLRRELQPGPDEFYWMWMPVTRQILGPSGPTDILIPSTSRTLTIAADGMPMWAEMDTPPRDVQNQWVIDLELGCDE